MKARIANVDIAYDDHGIGQPVLFLHAFPLNRSMWSEQITSLLQEQRFRLVAPDMRGFGESDSSGQVSTMEAFADDVAGLMDALGMPDAILCGLSMGGYIAFAFLRKYPQRVRGLILADTRPGVDDEAGKANRENVARLAVEQGTDAIADLQIPKLLSPHTLQQHPDVETRVRRLISAATPAGIAAASRGMAQRIDATDLLADITCPTLVLVGEQDSLTTPGVARDYTTKISGAQFAVIPHAGHLTNLEQSDTFLQIIGDFLRTSF